jgi:hypothetical protein
MKWVIWVVLFLAGCGKVTIFPSGSPIPGLAEPQFTATTFWYSNNSSAPKRRMLLAAVEECGLQLPLVESSLPHRGPWGIHGEWFLNFACPPDSQSIKLSLQQ